MTSPLTTTKLADALDAFWNAALVDAQGKGFEPMAVASLMATGFAAVAQALRAGDQAYPGDIVPLPQNADQAAAMIAIGRLYLKAHDPDRLVVKPEVAIVDGVTSVWDGEMWVPASANLLRKIDEQAGSR